jgi:hypothetical protein
MNCIALPSSFMLSVVDVACHKNQSPTTLDRLALSSGLDAALTCQGKRFRRGGTAARPSLESEPVVPSTVYAW